MFITLLGGIASQFVEEWRDNRQQKRQVKQAAAEFRQQMAKSESAYRHDWELRALEGSGLWMKRATLTLFSMPLIVAPFNPEVVQQYFVTLDEMPDWYLQAYGGMLATVWGLSELRGWKAGRGGNA